MREAVATLEKYIAPATVAAFLAAQGADRTVQAGWMLLALGGAVAVLLGAIYLQRPLSTIEKALAFLLAAFLISATVGLDPHRSLLLSVPMLASVLLWTLVVRDRHAGCGVLPVAIGLALAALVQSTLLVLAALRSPQLGAADWVIDAGAAWLIVPNDIAWMGCCLPLLAITRPRRAVAALFVLLVLFLALSALAHSRTAAVVAVAVALCFVALSIDRPRARSRGGWYLLAAAAAALLAFAVFSAASMHARWQLWGAAWSTFLAHPWTGVGLHDFVILYRQYLPAQAELIDPRITPWPHNLILEIAAECGLMGIIPAVFLAGLLVRRGYWLARTKPCAAHRAVLAGLLGMMLLALIEASLLRQWVWLLGIVLCALVSGDFERPVEVRGEYEQEESLDEDAARQPLHNSARR